MPAGQAHTIWFSELKDILKEKWNSKMSIEQEFDLVKELNNKLNLIRADLKIQPPMMWCPKCQKRERSIFREVSITAMYYAVTRFELCKDDYLKKLLRDWKKHSKMENIDIYGKLKVKEEKMNNKHD